MAAGVVAVDALSVACGVWSDGGEALNCEELAPPAAAAGGGTEGVGAEEVAGALPAIADTVEGNTDDGIPACADSFKSCRALALPRGLPRDASATAP